MKLPSYLIVLLSITLIVFASLTAVRTWNAYAEHDTIGRPPDVRDAITLTGKGEVTAKPDIARLSLGVVIDAKDVVRAQSENTSRMNSIIASLKKGGIDEKDMKTMNYSIYPQYDYTDGQQRLIGYQVSQNLEVKIRDLTKVGSVLELAGTLGANQVYGIQFDIDDPDLLEAEARALAIDDAREKADVLAKQLGVKVIRVIGFSEDTGGYPIPYPAFGEARDMALKEAAPQVEPGSQEVIKNVSVTFEIR